MLSPDQITAISQRTGIQPQASAAPDLSALDSAWGATDTQQADVASVKGDQASFPATGNESPLGAAAKTIGNLPKSAGSFAKGALDFLNPLNTMKTASKIGETIGQAQNEGMSNMDLAKETVKALPKAAYDVAVPQFLHHLFAGDLKKAAATIENDPVGQIAPLLALGRGVAGAAGKSAEFDSMISKSASPVTKTASAVTETAGNVTGGATRFLGGQLTGLSPDTIKQIVSNPKEFSKSAGSLITRPALAAEIEKAIQGKQGALDETGAEYKGVRESTQQIPVDPTYLDTLIQKTTGLAVKDGKLQATGSASIRLPGDVNALQTKLYNTWAPEFQKGFLTSNEYLNFRSDLRKMSYNDSGIGKSGALANLADVMAGKANNDIRPNISGLKNIDEHFGPQIEELKQLSKGLVDKDGNLSDSAINKIANATGKGKDPALARLEQLSPGITDKIKLLKAVEDISNSREVKVGTYLRAGALGAGLVTLNPYLIVSAIASIPEVAVPILRGIGMTSSKITNLTQMLGIPKAAKAINNIPNIAAKPIDQLQQDASDAGMSMGLSMKSSVPSPTTIANKLSIGDYKALKEYIGAKQGGAMAQVSPEVDMKIQDIFDKHGIEKIALPKTGPTPKPPFSDENSKTDYIQALVNAYEDSMGSTGAQTWNPRGPYKKATAPSGSQRPTPQTLK